MSTAMIGLYARESWNFVFGQSSLVDGTEIVSFARYGSGFYFYIMSTKWRKLEKISSSAYSVVNNYYFPEITSILLLWSHKCLIYEIGHKFGLWHYHWLARLMQGSSHLEEPDHGPLDLCPICLSKLQCATLLIHLESLWNMNFIKSVEAIEKWNECIRKWLSVLQNKNFQIEINKIKYFHIKKFDNCWNKNL